MPAPLFDILFLTHRSFDPVLRGPRRKTRIESILTPVAAAAAAAWTLINTDTHEIEMAGIRPVMFHDYQLCHFAVLYVSGNITDHDTLAGDDCLLPHSGDDMDHFFPPVAGNKHLPSNYYSIHLMGYPFFLLIINRCLSIDSINIRSFGTGKSDGHLTHKFSLLSQTLSITGYFSLFPFLLSIPSFALFGTLLSRGRSLAHHGFHASQDNYRRRRCSLPTLHQRKSCPLVRH